MLPSSYSDTSLTCRTVLTQGLAKYAITDEGVRMVSSKNFCRAALQDVLLRSSKSFSFASDDITVTYSFLFRFEPVINSCRYSLLRSFSLSPFSLAPFDHFLFYILRSFDPGCQKWSVYTQQRPPNAWIRWKSVWQWIDTLQPYVLVLPQVSVGLRPGRDLHCACGSSDDGSQLPKLEVELYIGKVLASHPTFEAVVQVLYHPARFGCFFRTVGRHSPVFSAPFVLSNLAQSSPPLTQGSHTELKICTTPLVCREL